MDTAAAEEAVESSFTIFGIEPLDFLFRVIYLAVIIALAILVQHFAVKLVRRALSKFEFLPSVTFIVNCVRVVIWTLALLAVLYPVFGITPSALLTALGVVSIALSLGLQDTISNIIGGLMLMAGHVIHPGDYVTVGDVTGTVVDVTMRHTVVKTRLGEHIVIPNSVLNTSSVQRLPDSSESYLTFDFTMDLGRDPDEVAADIIATVAEAGKDVMHEGTEPQVRFEAITPYGIQGKVCFYVKDGVPFSGVRDTLVRSVAKKDYFRMLGKHALPDAAGTSQFIGEQSS